MVKIMVFALATFLFLFGAVTPSTAGGKAFIGVYSEELDVAEIRELGFDGGYGILVSDTVKDGSARKAGLKKGDLLLSLDGDPVYTSNQLGKMLALRNPGETVKLEVFRDGKKKKFKFPLGESKEPAVAKKAFVGVILGELSEEKRKKLKVDSDHGIIVTETVDDGPAEKAGMEDGDVILAFDGVKMFTIDQLTKMLNSYKPETEVPLTVSRDGELKKFDVTLGEKSFDFPLLFENNLPGNVFVYKYLTGNRKKLGILAEPLGEKDMEKHGVKHGVRVLEVFDDLPAEKAGMKVDDIIITIGATKIEEVEDIPEALEFCDAGEKVEVNVIREGKSKKLNVKIAESDIEDIEEKVEISVDDGQVKILLDGDDEMLLDSKMLLENLKKHNLQGLQDECKKMKIECELMKDEVEGIKKMKIFAPGGFPGEDNAL